MIRQLVVILIAATSGVAVLGAGRPAGADDTPPPPGWTTGLVGGVSFTQAEFENWAEGGESSLTWNALLTYSALQVAGQRQWKTEAEAQFGQTRLGTGDLRKAADKIKLSSVNTWKLGAVVDPYVSLDAQTQFAPGYVYYGDAGKMKVEVSRFANPFYLNEGAGGSRQLAEGLTTRLGVAFHETFVTDTTFARIVNPDAGVNLSYTDDPDTPDKIEKSRLETGVESVTAYERAFNDKKLHVKSELKLFSQFSDLSSVQVNWTTKTTANVVSIVDVMLETDLVYNETVVKRTQFKEIFSLGITHTFF